MDGVLIDAKEWHYEALNQALSLFGMEISRYEHLISYDGLPTKKKLEMLSLERDLPRSLHQFINDMKQRYTMQIVYSECKPTFSHEYALSKLKHMGYKLAVASNSVRHTVDTMMRQASLQQYLEFSLSSQDVTNGKPDPEIYNTAIKRLGVLPEECLIVEDNENGKKAARASGARLMEVSTIDDVTYDNIAHHITNASLCQGK